MDPGVQKSNRESGGWHSSEIIEPGFLRSMLGSAAAVQLSKAAEAGLRLLPGLMAAIISLSTRILRLKGSGKSGRIFVQNIWGLSNRAGQYNQPHYHPGAVLAGTLHLSDGGSRAGALQFIDPRMILTCTGSTDPALNFMCNRCPLKLCPATESARSWEPVRINPAKAGYQTPPVPGQLLLWPAWAPHKVLPHINGTSQRLALAFNVWVDDKSPLNVHRAPNLSPAFQLEHEARFTAFEAELRRLASAPTRLHHTATKMFTRWPSTVAEFSIDRGGRVNFSIVSLSTSTVTFCRKLVGMTLLNVMSKL